MPPKLILVLYACFSFQITENFKKSSYSVSSFPPSLDQFLKS